FLYPSRGQHETNNPYKAYLWRGSEFHAVPQTIGYQASGSAAKARVTTDFDGDGISDFLRVSPETGAWVLQRSTGHHEPRGLVTQITNGLGAKTRIKYAPLTFSSVYQRDYDAPFATFGRGSALFDVATPMMVVQYVSSSAPAYTAPNDMADVQYFYRGL